MSAAVETWFGEAFAQLHPQLQQLHRNGGTLSGTVQIQFGQGIAGFIGRRIARKLGIPPREQSTVLTVRIYSTLRELHWNRKFGEGSTFESVFIPAGHYPDGYWTESSGSLQLRLGVSIVNGGWVWDPQGAWLWGLPVPSGFVPRTLASKHIELGLYRFQVQVSLPLLGRLLAYGGQLAAEASS